jgi:hypothetical protein
MWGYKKNIVYAVNISDLDHLQQKIIATVVTIKPDMLHHTWMERQHCLDVCRFTNGAHIERPIKIRH